MCGLWTIVLTKLQLLFQVKSANGQGTHKSWPAAVPSVKRNGKRKK